MFVSFIIWHFLSNNFAGLRREIQTVLPAGTALGLSVLMEVSIAPVTNPDVKVHQGKNFNFYKSLHIEKEYFNSSSESRSGSPSRSRSRSRSPGREPQSRSSSTERQERSNSVSNAASRNSSPAGSRSRSSSRSDDQIGYSSD